MSKAIQKNSRVIDLNADLGEGGAYDAEILQIVSSANIACGGHTGDQQSMREAVRLAKAHKVAIGAHPSFVDRVNFGRSAQNPHPDLLFQQLCEQVSQLANIAKQENYPLQHLKPHGALYNQAAHDAVLGEVIIRVIRACDPSLTLIGLAGSALLTQAQNAGIKTKAEAFADRRYNKDATLRARSFADACIESDDDAIQQVLNLIEQQQVVSVDGQKIHIEAQTICVHGDGEHALHLLKSIRDKCTELGYTIQSVCH